LRGVGATPVFVDHQPEDVPQLFRFSRELRPTGWYTLSGPLVMMIEAAAAKGWLDGDRARLESLLAIKRAGADLIISYYAERLAKLIEK